MINNHRKYSKTLQMPILISHMISDAHAEIILSFYKEIFSKLILVFIS